VSARRARLALRRNADKFHVLDGTPFVIAPYRYQRFIYREYPFRNLGKAWAMHDKRPGAHSHNKHLVMVTRRQFGYALRAQLTALGPDLHS
jgi:hypothetical protein